MPAQYRVVTRYPDQRPEMTGVLSREGADQFFGLVADSGRPVWVELQRRLYPYGPWAVIDWRGVRLVDCDGNRIESEEYASCPS